MFGYKIHSVVALLLISSMMKTVDSTQWFRNTLDVQTRDSYGCDALIQSCGKNGGCCDEHDACYKRHGCTYRSWLLVAATPICALNKCCQCNMKVMACVVAKNPGKSSCCSENTCGQNRLKNLAFLPLR